MVPGKDRPEPETKITLEVTEMNTPQNKLLYGGYVCVPMSTLTLALVAAKLTSLATDTLMQ